MKRLTEHSHGSARWRGLFVVLVLSSLLVTACSYHPPAPIEEHSTAIAGRQANTGGEYYVRKGDTLYGIAFSYGLDARELAKWNGITSPYTIYPGQKLVLSAPAGGSVQKADAGAVQITAAKPPAKTSTRPVTAPAEAEAQKPVAKTAAPAKAPGKPAPAVASAPQATVAYGPDGWKWPAEGRIRRGFVAGDPARNGLDIAGNEGQAIVASAAGDVVYSGNGLIGYGELIIIKHSEKMLSAYAHNKVRLAHEGDSVAAGQKIAEMGRNPAGQPNLHFEIRVDGRPVNPMNYLPKK
jgi:lipoprotein NlpD